MNILKGFEFTDKESIHTYHKQIEAIKSAFADGFKYVSDENQMDVTLKELLHDDYVAKGRKLITDTALNPEARDPKASATVNLSTADKEGHMASVIISNYMYF